MSKRISEDIMHDHPEWSDKDFACARPAADVLTELFGKEGAAKVMRARGRPK